MKPIRPFVVVSAAVVLGAVLIGGCYTQLALNNDDTEAVTDSESTEVVQPTPTAVVVEPIYVPVRPPISRLPIATTSTPGAVTQPSPQPIREIGNERTGSSSGQEHSGPPVRTSGPTRGGR
jgi:hypothetical protein